MTISPASKWTEGTAKTLTVDATDKAGNAITQISVSFTIDSTAPTAASTTPATGSSIITAQAIVLTFSESMSTTVTLGGTIGTAASAWTTTTKANDTLTITPSTEWTAGSATLTISGSDANGVALSQITLSYTVVASKYVTTTGSGSTCSKASPCATIQAGIDAATSGRVLVAQGTYSVAGKVAQMKEGVSLYGGYKTGDWSTRSAATYTTTLTNSDNTTAGAAGNPAETVEFNGSTAITSATVLDGFTINGSNVDWSTAIFIYNTASPIIQNCIIQGGSISSDTAIIAIYVANTSEPTIQNNTIRGGSVSTQSSVVIYSQDNATHPIITNNTIYFGAMTGAGTGYLFYEQTASSDFKTISNNTLVSTGVSGVTVNKGRREILRRIAENAGLLEEESRVCYITGYKQSSQSCNPVQFFFSF